jgi:lysozyme
MLQGIDVSNNNGTINWDRVARSGIAFALCKATEGADFRDAFLVQNFAACKRLGLARGAYHFARPSRNSAAGEARFFVSVVGGLLQPGDLAALDFEDEHLPVGAMGGVWAGEWLATVEAALGFRPLLYTYPSYVPERNVTAPALARYPLWWASYDLTAYPPPAPWGRYAIWQYTAGGKVPGIAGDCDLDSFDGPVEALRALGKGGSVGASESIGVAINERGETILTINFGGEATAVEGINIVDAGISVRNKAGETFDRSVFANVFQPWSKRP